MVSVCIVQRGNVSRIGVCWSTCIGAEGKPTDFFYFEVHVWMFK